MLTQLLLVICCQFDSVFDENVKPKVPVIDNQSKVERPFQIEFLTQASTGDGKIHIKAYSGKSCRWCKQSHDLVGEGDERIDIDWTEDELPEYIRVNLKRNYQFPVYVCDVEGDKVSWPQDWKIYNRDELYNIFTQAKPVKQKVYAATGSGGVIHGRDKVRKLFTWLDENVGKDVKIIIAWDRTGAQTFPFKSGTDWSANALLGRMGNFSLKANGAKNILFSEISTGYRFIDNTDDLELTPKIIIKSISTNKFSAEAPKKLDPITITTIISIGQILYQILNPKIDLQIPGNLEMEIIYTDQQLNVDFNRAPSIHVSAWFEFNLAVKRALLNLEKLHLDFTGSRWIKEREMNIVE